MKTGKQRHVAGKIILSILLAVVLLMASGLGYLKLFKPDVGPAPQVKAELTSVNIERGRYLANCVWSCMDCHSTRNWNQFAGPMVTGTLGKGGDKFGPEVGFPGTFYARNITPSALQHWTDGEIFRAISSGVTKNGEPVFPVMPYHYYGQADSTDLLSVVAYVRTLPAIENHVPASRPDFPVSFIMRTFPSRPHFQTRPDTADRVKYGAYLVNSAGCVDCHTQSVQGSPVKGMEYAGGRTFVVNTGKVTSANITPDKQTGIGSWTEDNFVKRFAQFRDSAAAHRPVKAGEFNTVMPWTMYAHIKDADLKAMYAYLQTVKPIQHQVDKFSSAELK